MTGKYDVEWVQLFGKEINLIIILFNEERLELVKLAEKLKKSSGYLSRRIKPLVDHGIVIVDRGESSGGRPPNIVKLSHKARQIMEQILITSTAPCEKTEIPDITSFYMFLDFLLDENESEHVADLIQQTSQVYRIPADSYYFEFLAKHLTESIPEKKIRIILGSTKNFVLEMNEQDKTRVFETLGQSINKVIKSKYPEQREYGIHKAAKDLLKQLDLKNLTYKQLEKRYLASIQDELGHPEYYRDIILSKHRDHIINLWLKVHELSKLPDQLVSSRAEMEKSLLR